MSFVIILFISLGRDFARTAGQRRRRRGPRECRRLLRCCVSVGEGRKVLANRLVCRDEFRENAAAAAARSAPPPGRRPSETVRRNSVRLVRRGYFIRFRKRLSHRPYVALRRLLTPHLPPAPLTTDSCRRTIFFRPRFSRSHYAPATVVKTRRRRRARLQ